MFDTGFKSKFVVSHKQKGHYLKKPMHNIIHVTKFAIIIIFNYISLKCLRFFQHESQRKLCHQ